MQFSAIEQVKITQAAEDHAAHWYGGPFGFGAYSAARYVAEGHLDDLIRAHGLSAVWHAVADVLAQRPELLTATKAEREDRKQARRQRVQELELTAVDHVRHGDFHAALQVVDAMELADPAYRPRDGLWSLDDLREGILTKAHGAA
jgi:hypothetical protein